MSITIHPYADEHVEAVRQFNGRLRAGGEAAYQFPASPVPAWLPKVAGRKLFQELYLAVDDAGAVRGGYILKQQQFWIKDRVLAFSDFQLPLSEGVIDKRFCPIGVQLLRDAVARQPLLFGLGMGGYDEAVARLLKGAGWSMFSIPFFFRIVHPSAFLRNVTYLRRRGATVRCALDALALSGFGWLGIHGLQAFRATVPRSIQPLPPSRSPSSLTGLTRYGRTASTSMVCRPCATPRRFGSCTPRTTPGSFVFR